MNGDPDNLDDAPAQRNWPAILGVLAAVVVFCAMILLIFWRNLSYDPPGLLVVEGNDFYANAKVSIESPGELPNSQTLVADREYRAQFPVKPGLHIIRVERDGQVYLAMPARVLEHQRHIVQLRTPSATQPVRGRR